MDKKKNTGCLPKVLSFLIGVFLITFGIGTLFGGSGSVEESENKAPLTETEIQEMYTNPNAFKGRTVELIGQIFTSSDRSGDEIAFQMYTDIENYDGNTLVNYESTDASFESGEYVKVVGVVAGEFSGKNAFGGKVSAAKIKAKTVEEMSYIDAIVPTIYEMNAEEPTKAQRGYSVTIDKVEISEKETRVYVTAENGGKNDFSLMTYSAKILQNGNQYEPEYNFLGDYPEVQSDLMPGAKTSGIICFPALENAEFQIFLEAWSDDWQEEIKPFMFSIK